MATRRDSAKLPELSERQSGDLEAEYSNQDPGDRLYRSELTEITPVEALKWNVDGDESPCMPLSYKPSNIGEYSSYSHLNSPRSRGLCLE